MKNHPRMIPGGIAVAFQTRRKELLTVELRRLRALPDLAGEGEAVLNALEMATLELWETQDALATLLGVTEDIQNTINGARRLLDLQEALTTAAHRGDPLPEGGPDAIREHFKQAAKQEAYEAAYLSGEKLRGVDS